MRYGRPSLPTPSGARAEGAREVDERVAAGGDLVEADMIVEAVGPAPPGPNTTEGMPAWPRIAASVQNVGASPLRRAAEPTSAASSRDGS